MGGRIVPHCTQFPYLGAPVLITTATNAQQRIHLIVQDLQDKLQQHFAPVIWLANNATGVDIHIAKIIYTLFLLSVIDYHSPALCQLLPASLEPLEKFQNRVMRFILVCSASTKIVNMLSELNLSPLVDRIYTNVTYFTVKCLRSPHLTPHCSNVIRAVLLPRRTWALESTGWPQPHQECVLL